MFRITKENESKITSMSGTMDDTNPFVEWLQEQLQEKGWTVAELARRADTPQSGLVNIVNRQKNLGIDVAKRIARALGISQIELFARALLIDEPIEPETAVEKDLLSITRDLTTEDRDRLLLVARAYAAENRRKAKLARGDTQAHSGEETKPKLKPTG